MKTNRLRIGFRALVYFYLGLWILAFSCTKRNDKIGAELVFRFAMQPNPENKAWEAGRLVKESLEQQSGGKINIKFYDSGKLGGERQILEAAYLGLIEMAQVTSSVVTTLNSQFNTLDMPYLFIDEEHHQSVLNGEIGRELLDGLREHHFQGLAFFSCGFRHIYAKKPIQSPEDLRSMKIRVMESPIMLNAINAMGATATPLAAPEVFTALKTGMIDGAENNPQVYVADKYIECVKYYSLTSHFANQHVLVANKEWFDSLKPEYQLLIQKVAREVIPEYNRLWNEAIKKAMDDIIKLGGTITPVSRENIKKFIKLVEPIYKENSESVPWEMVQRIRKEGES